MLQTRMALMPQNDMVLVPNQSNNSVIMNCYGEGCTGGTMAQYTQKPFYETPYFIGGGLFVLFILIFVGFLILRNRKKKKK